MINVHTGVQTNFAGVAYGAAKSFTLYLIEREAGSKKPLFVCKSTLAIEPGPNVEPLVGSCFCCIS